MIEQKTEKGYKIYIGDKSTVTLSTKAQCSEIYEILNMENDNHSPTKEKEISNESKEIA